MSTIAIIPARANSKRIPHKNRKLFHGKPIIQYSIDAAKESGIFDRIYVSTDDPETMEIISGQGVLLHLRSTAYLCGDEAGTQEVAQDCLLNSTSGQHDYACVLYPTAPLMTAHDIIQMYEWMVGQWSYGMIEGWLYWGLVDSFISGLPILNSCCSWKPARWIDINTPDDWTKAETMYAALHGEKA